MSRFSMGYGLTSHGLPFVSCDNKGMRFPWTRLLSITASLALALACANCGGGTTGSTLNTGGGSGNGGNGSGGSGNGSGGNGSGGSGSGSGATQSACSAMSTGQGANLNGFRPFGS